MHRAKQIAPRECGWKHGDSGERPKEKPGEQNEIRIYLTPTGLLMEGDYTQNPLPGHFERNGNFAATTIQGKDPPFVPRLPGMTHSGRSQVTSRASPV
jgi:hypothetical protein